MLQQNFAKFGLKVQKVKNNFKSHFTLLSMIHLKKFTSLGEVLNPYLQHDACVLNISSYVSKCDIV